MRHVGLSVALLLAFSLPALAAAAPSYLTFAAGQAESETSSQAKLDDCPEAEYAKGDQIPKPPEAPTSILPRVPTKACPASQSPIPDALAKAVEALERSKAVVAEATAAVAQATVTLAQAQERLSSGTAQLAIDRELAAKAWADYLDPRPPQPVIEPPKPVPVPPAVKGRVAIIELARSQGCPACDAMTPAVLSLIKDGVPISRVNIDVQKTDYTAAVVPTFVLLIDGKERQRVEGTYSREALRAWYDGWRVWSESEGK